MTLADAPNINHLWATLMIEELIRNGVNYFCIAPGSRSAPLTTAVALNKKSQSLVHFDERGLGFHALGYTSAKAKACCIITTSGTAAANLFPAIIEASKKKLPLIILTADRPAELRHTGAHQTIDQVKLYGEYVRWHFDMPVPNIEINPEFVLTTVDQAVHQATSSMKGPVHINCMYREPLAPLKIKNNFSSYLSTLQAWLKSDRCYTYYTTPCHHIGKHDIETVVLEISKIKIGIIGGGKLSADEQPHVLKLAEKLNWPVFPDTVSGLRLGDTHRHVIHYFDQILLSEKSLNEQPDGILHLGGRLTSKRWYQFIERVKPNHYMTVLNHPLRNDPLHRVTTRIQAPVGEFCQIIEKQVSKRKPLPYLSRLAAINKKIHDLLCQNFEANENLTEPMVARIITEQIPKNFGLFLSNSLPIREIDMYASNEHNKVSIASNRGASGIDGTVASAAGFSKGIDQPVILFIGDLALLHDLNSLAMFKEPEKPNVIIVLNNNGGGIFSFLPIAQFENIFERYFATPHGLEFSAVAQMFSLNYSQPKTKTQFARAFENALNTKITTLIEVMTHRALNVKIHKKMQKEIISMINKF